MSTRKLILTLVILVASALVLFAACVAALSDGRGEVPPEDIVSPEGSSSVEPQGASERAVQVSVQVDTYRLGSM